MLFWQHDQPLRIEFKGADYHITSGGNTRQAIFLPGKDFFWYPFCLMFCGKNYYFILYTYCLSDGQSLSSSCWNPRSQLIKKHETMKWFVYSMISLKTSASRTLVSRVIKRIEREDEKWYCKTWPFNIYIRFKSLFFSKVSISGV